MFKSLTLVAFIFLISLNLFSQEGRTIIQFKKGAGSDPILDHLVGRFNDSIGKAVEKRFPTKPDLRIRRIDRVYGISFNLDRVDDIDLKLQFVVRKITNDDDVVIFDPDFPFSYPQTESVLTFIGETLIGGQLDELVSGAAEAADLENDIGRKFDEYHLETKDVPSAVLIRPKWGKEIPDDTPIYVKILSPRLSIESFDVEKRSRADDFPLSSEVIRYDQIGNPESLGELTPERKQLFDILRNIKPQMVISRGGRDIKTVAGVGESHKMPADENPITEYRVVYSFAWVPLPGEEYKVDSNTVSKTYKIRQIPYYDFSKSMRKVKGDALVCGFDNSTVIVRDINPFLQDDFKRDYAKPRLRHYMHIDPESASVLNPIRGDMEIVISQNFDMTVSIVKYAFGFSDQLSERFKSGEYRNEYLLDYLLDVNEYGEPVALAQEISGNRFSLALNEEIDTHKADWFIRMEFTSKDNALGENELLLPIKSLENQKAISNFPVSDSARTLIIKYITDRGKEAFKNNNGYYLDIAKLLMYLGNKRDAIIYLGYYKEGLGNRYRINNNHEQYKIAFYEGLAGYYYGLRYGDPVQYSPPRDDLINKEVEKDTLVERMGQFRGVDTDLDTKLLANEVLFEVRKRSENHDTVSASEFIRFNFPEILTGYIFRLPGLDPDDIKVLRDAFNRGGEVEW